MNFYIPDHIMRWLGPSIIIALGMLILLGNPISLDHVCEGTSHCLSTWVGALSGWAALGGALLTVAVMRRQLQEQIRQTDHMMGNGPPEMVVEPSYSMKDDVPLSELKITVINRNRRSLRLLSISAKSDHDVEIGIKSTIIGDQQEDKLFSTWARNDYVHRTIPGKDDGIPAMSCTIVCHIFRDKNLVTLGRDPDDWNTVEMEIELKGFLQDSREIPLHLTAYGTVQI